VVNSEYQEVVEVDSEFSEIPNAWLIPEQLSTLSLHDTFYHVGGSGLKLEDMWDDIKRVIASIARTYTDEGRSVMHYDELFAEGMFKLAVVLDKGWLDKSRSRVEFFKIFKTSVNNHIKGLVQKNCYTIKRTGVRPPPRGEVNFGTPTKPVEISLNDPDANLQVGEGFDFNGVESRELNEEILSLLTPVEQLVYNQLISPNIECLTISEYESYRGRKPGSVKVRVTYDHMAAGLGMDCGMFMGLLEKIRGKVKNYMENGIDHDINYNAAVAGLKQLFEVQYPENSPSIEPVVIKRMFTFAAWKESKKVFENEKAVEWLKIVGAVPPTKRVKSDPENLKCFGIMFDAGHKICQSCGIKQSCQAEVTNNGLDKVVISPKVIPLSKRTRIPHIVPNDSDENDMMEAVNAAASPSFIEDGAAPVSEHSDGRDDEIKEYVRQNFRYCPIMVKGEKQEYFRHKENIPGEDGEKGKIKYIFWAKDWEKDTPIVLRICSPSQELEGVLQKQGRSWYIPASMSADEAIKIIDRHAKDKFTSKED
jgi:hypothetical protein